MPIMPGLVGAFAFWLHSRHKFSNDRFFGFAECRALQAHQMRWIDMLLMRGMRHHAWHECLQTDSDRSQKPGQMM